MARFLLVGGGGFIGAHVARRLLDAGDDVVVLDAGVDYERSPPAQTRALLDWRRDVLLDGAEIVSGNAADAARLQALLRRWRPEHVVHLGNLPLADLAAADPVRARASIVHATTSVVTAAASLPRPPALTYVSSSMVYGDFATDPMGEAGPLRPRAPYGRLKLDAERRLSTVAGRARLPLTIVRPSAVYGPGDVNGRVLQRLVDAATQATPFVLTAAPSTRIDFTWVQDAAAGIHAAALRKASTPRAYNVTSGAARTIAAAIDIVRAHVPELNVVSGPCDAAATPRRGTLDTRRARRELGWAPHWTLEQGLVAYLGFARGVAPAYAAA
jgi:UDP-glucose 4-epimerase